MRSLRLLCACCLLALLPLSGCGGRKPPPVVTVEVTERHGIYRLNGERIGEVDLKRELSNIASEHRRAITGTSSVRVAITAPTGGNDRRARELARYCSSVGLEAVYFRPR